MRHRVCSWWVTSVVLFLCALVPAQTHAQALNNKSVSGTVKAASDSPVPNATLSIKNLTNGVIELVPLNEDGSSMVSGLLPGTYEITSEAPGFTGASMTVKIADEIDQVASLVLLPVGNNQEDRLKQGAQSACCDTMNSKAVG